MLWSHNNCEVPIESSFRRRLLPDLLFNLRNRDHIIVRPIIIFFPAVFGDDENSTQTTAMRSSSSLVQAFFISALLATIPPVMSLKNIVVVGGGIQGTSVAYHLAKATQKEKPSITLLEAVQPAAAASGKGGGFMARSWGDGSPTEKLHHLAFDMYEELAAELGCTSYRKLPVLSVTPGYDGLKEAAKKKDLKQILPSWLDGKVGRVSAMGYGLDTAQITPAEFVDKMLQATAGRVTVQIGTCVGIESDQGSERGSRKVTGVKFIHGDDNAEPTVLPADVVVVAAGPWSCAAEDWFPNAQLDLPMEGIKSTSIVWKQPGTVESVDATALFCGEDDRFGTHRECRAHL